MTQGTDLVTESAYLEAAIRQADYFNQAGHAHLALKCLHEAHARANSLVAAGYYWAPPLWRRYHAEFVKRTAIGGGWLLLPWQR